MLIFHFALVDSKPGANVFQEQKPRAVYVGLEFSQKWGHGKKAPFPQAYVDTQSSAGVYMGCSSAAQLLLWSLSQQLASKEERRKRKSSVEHSLSVRSESVNRGQERYFSC